MSKINIFLIMTKLSIINSIFARILTQRENDKESVLYGS